MPGHEPVTTTCHLLVRFVATKPEDTTTTEAGLAPAAELSSDARFRFGQLYSLIYLAMPTELAADRVNSHWSFVN